MRIVVLSKIIFYLCILFSVYSCGDSVLTIRDVELKQDIHPNLTNCCCMQKTEKFLLNVYQSKN